MLLYAAATLVLSALAPGAITGWPLFLENNWLIVIFKLHAEFNGAHSISLHGLNFLDIAILALVGTICLSLSTAFKKAGRIWVLVAAALSLIAIILFVVTQIAGRSTVMLAVLIVSFAMLGNKRFSRVAVYSGILAGVCLFIGDLTVGMHSTTITIFFGIGYVLLSGWLFLTGMALLRLGQGR
jgi:hypothetical protein